MELWAKTEIDQYHRVPEISTGGEHSYGSFYVVHYGWYAFAFILNQDEYPSPKLAEDAVRIATSLFLLEG